MLTIALTKMKLILTDKASLAWMIIAPILFITVIVYGFDGTENKCNITIVDNDKTEYSQDFISLIKENTEYPIRVKEILDAKSDLVDGRSIALITIPKGYSKLLLEEEDNIFFTIQKLRDNDRIIAIKNMVDNIYNRQKISSVIGEVALKNVNDVGIQLEDEANFVSDIKTKYDSLSNNEIIQIVEINESVNETEMSELSYSAIGIMLIFILFFVINSAGTLLDEKNNGIADRIRISKLSEGQILIGQALGLLFVGWLQIILLIFVGRYLYRIDWGKHYLGLGTIFTAFLFCGSSLGVLISCIAKNRRQMVSLIAIIVMPTSLLGGCMWSKDMMSEVLIKISYLTPQSWMIDGITNLISRDASISTAYKPISALCVFSLAFLLLSFLINKCSKKYNT